MDSFVFVYGTLKKGYRNHHLLEGATFVSKVVTPPNYLLYDCGPFPCMIEVSEGQGRAIEGELYQVSSKIVSKLDHLEGVPHLYKRKKVTIVDNKDVVWKSHIYIFNQSVERYLDCGTSWPRS